MPIIQQNDESFRNYEERFPGMYVSKGPECYIIYSVEWIFFND